VALLFLQLVDATEGSVSSEGYGDR
jgi:hypothetical protein